MELLIGIGMAVAGVLIAIPLSIAATRAIRRNPKRSAGFVVASALLLSFPFLGGSGPEFVDESKDQSKRKKDDAAGDPPVAGGDDA